MNILTINLALSTLVFWIAASAKRTRHDARITMRVRGNFRLAELLPTQECTTTFYPWYPRAVLPAAPRTCPSSFASESISRTFPDTRQRHGGFVGLARRFS